MFLIARAAFVTNILMKSGRNGTKDTKVVQNLTGRTIRALVQAGLIVRAKILPDPINSLILVSNAALKLQ